MSCGGSGRVQQTDYHTDADGTRRPHHHHHTCHSCGGSGSRQCLTCLGAGRVRCRHCSGSGQLVIYIELKIQWKNVKTERVLMDTMNQTLQQALPANRLSAADGPVLLAEQGVLLSVAGQMGQERVNPAVNTLIDDLLRESQQVSPRVMHQQRLIVRGLPVYELVYADGDAEKRLWVIGTDRRVYAPDYPRSALRISILVVSIVVPILVIIFVLLYFFYLKPNNLV